MQSFLLALQKRLQKSSHIQIVLDTPFAFAILGLLPYQQRLSRVAEGTGPQTPQQPGCNCQGANSCPVGRDKILN